MLDIVENIKSVHLIDQAGTIIYLDNNVSGNSMEIQNFIILLPREKTIRSI